MSIELVANMSYIVAAVLFIFGLKMLGHPNSARRGNALSALGMFIAITAGLTAEGIVAFEFIALGVLIGAVVGALASPWLL